MKISNTYLFLDLQGILENLYCQKIVYLVEKILKENKADLVIDLNEDTLEHINRFASHGVKTESIFKDDLRKIHLELINMKEVLKKEVKNVESKWHDELLITSGVEQEDDKSIVIV